MCTCLAGRAILARPETSLVERSVIGKLVRFEWKNGFPAVETRKIKLVNLLFLTLSFTPLQKKHSYKSIMESSTTLVSNNDESPSSHNQLSSASHRLSQTLNGLAHVGNRNRSSSVNASAAPNAVIPSTQSTSDSTAPTSLVIEFDGGSHVIVRPNRTIRGTVYK